MPLPLQPRHLCLAQPPVAERKHLPSEINTEYTEPEETNKNSQTLMRIDIEDIDDLTDTTCPRNYLLLFYLCLIVICIYIAGCVKCDGNQRDASQCTLYIEVNGICLYLQKT